jgi:hypothetical protein
VPYGLRSTRWKRVALSKRPAVVYLRHAVHDNVASDRRPGPSKGGLR